MQNKLKKKTKIVDEFKEFISRGSVVDLAVGIIIGSSFTAIVTSFVNDILMPLIGLLLGKINLMELKLVLVSATETTKAVSINYGIFVQRTIDFLLTAIAVFIMIKFINELRRLTERKKEENKEVKETPKVEPEDIVLLREIRNLLRQDRGKKVKNVK